jgi:hypothetical protein
LVCAGCDWRQWGGGATHVGTNAFEDTLTTGTVSELVPSTVSTSAPTGQVVISDGLVIVQRDGAVTALDEHDHGVVWVGTLPAGSTTGSVPAIDAGAKTVFVVVSTASNLVLLGFDIEGVRNCNPLLRTCLPVFRAELGGRAGARSTTRDRGWPCPCERCDDAAQLRCQRANELHRPAIRPYVQPAVVGP